MAGAAERIRTLTKHDCKFIEGDVRSELWDFCRKPRLVFEDGMLSPYCSDHSKICLRPVPPIRWSTAA